MPGSMLVRPRPSVVSLALLVIALLHAWWGAKLLLDGAILSPMSQLVSAGGLLLASVGVRSRSTFATGLFVAGAATSVRVFMALGPGSPIIGPTALLTAAFLLAGWGAWKLDEGRPGAPAALRAGLVLVGLAYLGFVALFLSFGRTPGDVWDLAVRGAAGLVAASFVDAPPVDWARPFRRKARGPQNDAAS